jgi:hypothetical protein
MSIKIIEILQYTLNKGTGEEFHKVMEEVSVPLHLAYGLDVVSFGKSLHDPDSYFLIRAFDSLTDLENSQEKFYKSAEWIQGPRADIIERIQHSLKTVIELPIAAVEQLRTC